MFNMQFVFAVGFLAFLFHFLYLLPVFEHIKPTNLCCVGICRLLLLWSVRNTDEEVVGVERRLEDDKEAVGIERRLQDDEGGLMNCEGGKQR